jgi:hypothetical protein
VFTQGSPSNAALFVCQNQRCHDHRYANTPSIAISKSLSQTKSLHAHAITVKLTKSIAERLLRQNSVQNPNDTPGLVQQELCFGSAKHEFFIRCLEATRGKMETSSRHLEHQYVASGKLNYQKSFCSLR